MSYESDFPAAELPHDQASLVLKDTDYSDVLSTMSSLLEMGPDVISGLMDSLAEKVTPLLKDEEKFVNLHFGLEVFPDENSGVCVFVITCGEEGKYGKMSLKYDPLGGKRRKEVRLARGSRNVVRIDDLNAEPIVADTEAAVIDRLDSFHNGSDEESDGGEVNTDMFSVLVSGRVDTSTKYPQDRFRNLVDTFAGFEE